MHVPQSAIQGASGEFLSSSPVRSPTGRSRRRKSLFIGPNNRAAVRPQFSRRRKLIPYFGGGLADLDTAGQGRNCHVGCERDSFPLLIVASKKVNVV
jgi:hypothetical protein